MKKEELLKQIDRALDIEEEAVQSLSKHIQVAVDWDGFTTEENSKIKKVLVILAEESKEHKKMLENLRERILSENVGNY